MPSGSPFPFPGNMPTSGVLLTPLLDKARASSQPLWVPRWPPATTCAPASPPSPPREGRGFHTQILLVKSAVSFPDCWSHCSHSLPSHNPPLFVVSTCSADLCRQHTVDAQPGQPSGKTRGATQPVPSEHLPALPGHQVHEQDRPSAVRIQR